ncbi:MAG: transposase [Acidobacteriota bacterium]|nr:transposase [Acidobacteriota bacterium]
MSRGKLYYIPGYAWHLTHRCHNKEYLLEKDCDKRNWMNWIHRAMIKYGLRILNYAVTSNHIHLLVFDEGRRKVIPRSMQLAESRTAREYNLRNSRSGAFWDGNYHATAVETGVHLWKCLVYIDLNMVRAGVVKHPADWHYCGYQEMNKNRDPESCLIDLDLLKSILNIKSLPGLRNIYRDMIEKELRLGDLKRQAKWTESLAVGNEEFVDQFRGRLGIRVIHRQVCVDSGSHVLRESEPQY